VAQRLAFAPLRRRGERLRLPVGPRPNPRLQRTRSALLRSPLSRKPLGSWSTLFTKEERYG
jgi:hypothetical protein